eukprot:gene3687-3735_t
MAAGEGGVSSARQETRAMLRFAPRYGIVAPALVRLSRQVWRPAANDNQRPAAAAGEAAATTGPLGDARVQAALRLFAAHGLSAAEQARRAAANANALGHDSDARWWQEISTGIPQRLIGRGPIARRPVEPWPVSACSFLPQHSARVRSVRWLCCYCEPLSQNPRNTTFYRLAIPIPQAYGPATPPGSFLSSGTWAGVFAVVI